MTSHDTHTHLLKQNHLCMYVHQPWKQCNAQLLRKPTSGNNRKMDDWALEEDINHYFYTCEKKGGPGKKAIRLYPEDHAAMAKRINKAVEGALREDSDDDGLFDDSDNEEKKELTEEEVRELALAKGKAASKAGNSFFGTGYLDQPPKWG